MLSNIRRILRPASVEEALHLLEVGGGAVKAMAGGTAAALFRSRRISGIVDLWSLPLRFVREEAGELRIGATATLGELGRSSLVRGWAGGLLAEAAGAAGSSPLRNLITAGGNLAALYPWSDLPPALLVADARVRVAGPAGPELGIEELVTSHPSKVLGTASLITEIVVPAGSATVGSVFRKFGASTVDYAWLDVAVLVEADGDACRRCRLAVGAVEARCRRLHEVEERVVGRRIDGETARAAGELTATLVEPLRDPRVSVDYRRELVGTLVGRALLEAWKRATGGGGGS